MNTSPSEEKMMEEWSKSDIAKRVRWVNDLAEQRGCEKWTGQTIPEWWLEKVAQARQEEQDQIEVRMKEWVETRRKEYCKEDVLLEKNKPYDWHGYSHACRDFLSALPTIIFNTQEHGK